MIPTNRLIPFVTGPIDPLVTANVVGIPDFLIPRQPVLPNASITDKVCSCAHIFRTPSKVRQTGRDDSIPQDLNSDENSRLIPTSPVSNPNSVYSARFRNQEVISSSHPSIEKRGRKDEPFDAPIDGFLAINGHSTSYFSEVIGL